MSTVVLHHRVQEFDAWKRFFDSVEGYRREAGMVRWSVYRGVDDANAVTLVIDFTSSNAARSHFGDPELAAKMSAAGVVSAPEVHFLETA